MTRPPEDSQRGNSGVSFGSGNVFNGPVAGGIDAHIVQVQQDRAEARLDDLLRQLETGLHALDDAQAKAALADLGRLRNELDQRPPDRLRLHQLIDRIKMAIPTVSGLLNLLSQVADLIKDLH
jgi:hypothetical protein